MNRSIDEKKKKKKNVRVFGLTRRRKDLGVGEEGEGMNEIFIYGIIVNCLNYTNIVSVNT